MRGLVVPLLAVCVAFCLPSSSATDRPDFEAELGHLKPSASPSVQEEAARGVLERLLGHDEAALFQINVRPELRRNGKDKFKVYKSGEGPVVVNASSGVTATWGVHVYLKYYCNVHVSWDGDLIALPDALPDVNLTEQANDRFRYYQNVCTTSYSFVWWDIDRWVREIDWMALNGYNLALAFTAHEYVWKVLYLELGLTEAEIDQHYSGPAFLAWNRMGNMRGWGGPLTTAWHDKSVALQKSILAHMRSLGIIPVLPAFAGQVPTAFSRLYPKANFTQLARWNNFPNEYCCPYLLSPEDPLFQTIGTKFIQKYEEIFGTDHVYNCDTFNEMTPSSGDVCFLRSVGKAIYNGMATADPKAVWMLQGWMLKHDASFWTKSRTKALLTSVPIGKMLVLDLQSELNPQFDRYDSYFGQPFIWCMLHNFGGTLGMHGSAHAVNKNPFDARREPGSTMVGTGLTPEGINQNYVMYDLMSEMSWRKEPVSLNEWFRKYSIRRYGEKNYNAIKAWRQLKDSVYNYRGSRPQHGHYILVRRPQLNIIADTWYEPSLVVEAWSEMLLASRSLSGLSVTFQHDLVDVTRQALQILLDQVYYTVIGAFYTHNTPAFRTASQKFLLIMDDLDLILKSHNNFLLGKWLEDAKAMATNPQEEKLYEMNARNQVTMWGPDGQISDYANKQWSGLVADYYKRRWEVFFYYLQVSLEKGVNFDQKKVQLLIYNEIEKPFTHERKSYPIISEGNPITLSTRIYDRWVENQTTFRSIL